MQGHKWATVSLPNGAQSAVKAFKDNWEYIAGFDTVVLMFDMDEVWTARPGRRGATCLSAKPRLPACLIKTPTSVCSRAKAARSSTRSTRRGNTALMASWQLPITARRLVWTMLPRPSLILTAC